ncbi:MAG TPA: ASCH domain-containing protein [Actinophytocola sp.]|uniref:ASCH domain-containing protein n=1 Tax=Actinophytocola sp. TaxID=1872138 RepID=UPI002DDD54A5|nr:ASCH domain-containing protein [Actinophytocola sp.]HEV2779098.1 ASCH domain-containing protein [Actinophytocola sp.]
MKVRVLTIKQPWAWAIACGHKLVENRTWRSPYRGPLAIHAGKGWDEAGAPAFKRICESLRIPLPDVKTLPYGALVAVASSVNICTGSTGSRYVRCECGPWAVGGQFHWRLSNMAALPDPFPVSGKQGLWEIELPDDFPIGGAR